LEQLANRLENEQYAQANLMRSYYSLNNFDSAVIYADKLLSKSDLPDSLKLDAQLVLVRSEWNKNNFEASFRAYEFVGKNATGSIAAEAAYYLALAKNKRGDFVESNKDIQALAKNFPAYKIWAAQGLVLMADNFTALKDTFQAHYILSSVRDNFSQFPKIVQEANQRLQTMTVSNTQKEKSIVKNDSIKQ
jgi:tetratricopeptide (TPR) repeat protein